MSDQNNISVTVLVEDRRNNISELTLISEHSLLLTCPFTGAKWRFHTQEQADMIQKSLDVHAAALTAEMDALKAENRRLVEDVETGNAILAADVLRQYQDENARLKAPVMRAMELADAMETCHICKGTLLVDESAPHCEDCSGDCDYHDEPECESIYTLHAALKAALLAARSNPPEPPLD